VNERGKILQPSYSICARPWYRHLAAPGWNTSGWELGAGLGAAFFHSSPACQQAHWRRGRCGIGLVVACDLSRHWGLFLRATFLRGILLPIDLPIDVVVGTIRSEEAGMALRRFILGLTVPALAAIALACSGEGSNRNGATKPALVAAAPGDAKPASAMAGTDAEVRAQARAKARAQAEADAAAQDAINRNEYEAAVARVKQQHSERLAKFKLDQRAYEEARAAYEVAKSVYDATRLLSQARGLYDDGQAKVAKSIQPEGDKLLEFADRRFREIIKRYPATDSAKDAKALLARRNLAPRKVPPQPVEPVPPIEPQLDVPSPPPVPVIYPPDDDQTNVARSLADDDFREVKGGDYQTPVRSASGKTVYVRGYFRRDGTYVAPHMRSSPGSGAAKSSGGRRK
jgi:hypothetical protein